MADYPGYATVQVRAELSLTELCHLYWDALVGRFGSIDGSAEKEDADRAADAVDWSDSRFINRDFVKELVREQLTWYGKRSVECGPRNDYPSDAFAEEVKAIVARAYKIVY